MQKVITSVTIFTTAEGVNVTFTYSLINEIGEKIVENDRKNLVVFDNKILTNIDSIKGYALEKLDAILDAENDNGKVVDR